MRPRPIMWTALLLASLVAIAPGAHAGHGGGPKFQAWTWNQLNKVSVSDGYCAVDLRVYMMEHGQHGVEQFKVRWKWYLENINEHALSADFLRSSPRYDSGWVYSGAFPNDARNFTYNSRLFVRLPFGATVENGVVTGGTQTIRAKAVGIRPSWWRPDLVVHVHIAYCVEEVSFGS